MKKEIIRNILKVFAVGGSALTMAGMGGLLVYLAGWLFFHIPRYTGYAAVVAFVLALLTIATALIVVYMCGAWVVRKGKFAR